MKKIILTITILLIALTGYSQTRKYLIYADINDAYDRNYKVNTRCANIKWKDGTTVNYSIPIENEAKNLYALEIYSGYESYFTSTEIGIAVTDTTGFYNATISGIIVDSKLGVTLKDSQAPPHYWKYSVGSSGSLIVTDLGTSY